ncbi:ATP-binding protein [Nocardioides yefusunii]|uniref:ATP-binding protein n=1 Tax=Nocardioides yefusunii TaxID=2500546 RepID=A0ABW1QVA5_9ACTN|nr:ATP-binding protein [Nocardioides yefusunii]
MPLNRDALALDTSPRAAAVARRWVASVCRDLGREDLVHSAELGVSELVTNAILHGKEPVDVRVRGTAAHPRIEVFDASHCPPTLPLARPAEWANSNHGLETYGRGLTLVALTATTWGTTIEESGKVVWFEPAGDIADEPVLGVFEDLKPVPGAPLPGSRPIRFEALDARLFHSMLTHYSNLRRELRLLSISHTVDYPVTHELSPHFLHFQGQFSPRSLRDSIRVTQEAHARGDDEIDVVLEASPLSADVFRDFLDTLDVADQFCTSQQLLSLARTPEQKALMAWMFEEFLRQTSGHPPTPCPHSRRARAQLTSHG